MGGDDERRIDFRREQTGGNQKMRPDDVWPRGATDTLSKLEVARLPAGAPVEHRKLDVVTALSQRTLAEGDERAEVGIVRPRVHLRDEEDAHAVRRLPRRALTVVFAPLLAQGAADLADGATRAQCFPHREEQVAGAAR
jgi:hypothetical protein